MDPIQVSGSRNLTKRSHLNLSASHTRHHSSVHIHRESRFGIAWLTQKSKLEISIDLISLRDNNVNTNALAGYIRFALALALTFMLWSRARIVQTRWVIARATTQYDTTGDHCDFLACTPNETPPLPKVLARKIGPLRPIALIACVCDYCSLEHCYILSAWRYKLTQVCYRLPSGATSTKSIANSINALLEAVLYEQKLLLDRQHRSLTNKMTSQRTHAECCFCSVSLIF